jgi:VWFA-related protein
MRATLVAIAVVLSSITALPQSPFRAGTEIVSVFATVRGPDGHLVTGLKAEDFELLDRGVPVPLALFSDEPQPLTLALMVDMSGGGFERNKYALLHKALLAFVDKLQPQDRARIGTFAWNEIALGHHLTSDHAELNRVINEELWMGYGARPLWNAVGLAIKSLSGEPGRRVVVVIANGPDTASLPNLPSVKDVEKAATDDGFMVYGVSLFTENQLSGSRAMSLGDGPGTRLTLREVAEATGGGFIQAVPIDPNQRHRVSNSQVVFGNIVDDRLVPTLANVVEELRYQYALGFAPKHRDGRVGKIEVRVKRPNTTVSARKTYRAPGGGS